MLTPREIYERAFANKNYSRQPQSCFRYEYAISAVAARHPQISSIMDLGSGRGVFARMLIERWPQLSIETADLKKFHNLDCPHHEIDLTNINSLRLLSKQRFDSITCLDVLEHIPEEHVTSVVESIAVACRFAVVTAANHSSKWSGIELHLIRRPRKWWDCLLSEHFKITDSTTWHESRLYVYQLESDK